MLLFSSGVTKGLLVVVVFDVCDEAVIIDVDV